ncbi:MAG: radical SAM protein [Eubacteriales bacterium]|nr:radical SAM protein [Eubacteriales bacterium]
MIILGGILYKVSAEVLYKLYWREESIRYMLEINGNIVALEHASSTVFHHIILPRVIVYTDDGESICSAEAVIEFPRSQIYYILFEMIRNGYVSSMDCISASVNAMPQFQLSKSTFLAKVNDKNIIGNCSYGTTDYINDELYDQIAKKHFHSIPQKTIEILYARKYLADANESKPCSWQSSICQNYIVLTYDCNLGCIYCFEKERRGNQCKMSETTLDRILCKCDEADQMQTMVLYGGEPLLHNNRRKIEKIIDFVGGNPTRSIRIITNGINASQIIPLLSKIKNQVQYFTITVDGDREIHNLRRPFASGMGSFDATMESIKLIIQAGYYCVVRINIDSDNYDSIYTFCARISSLYKADQFCISLARVEDATKSDRVSVSMDKLTELYYSLKNIPSIVLDSNIPFIRWLIQNENEHDFVFRDHWETYCAPHCIKVYDVDGQAYWCNESMGNAFFLADTLESTLNSSEFIYHPSENCATCELFPLCLGNCPRINWLNKSQKLKNRCEKEGIARSLGIFVLKNKSSSHFFE